MAKEQQSWGCEWMDTNKNHLIRKRRGWSTMIFRSMVYLFALNYFYKWDVTHQHTPRYWFELCLMFRFFLITFAGWLHNLIDMGRNHQLVIVHLRSKLSRASGSWMFRRSFFHVCRLQEIVNYWNHLKYGFKFVKSLLDVTISATVLKKCSASLTGTIESPQFWAVRSPKSIPKLRWFSSETRMLVSHWVIHSEWPSLGDSVPPAPWHPLEGFMAVFFVGGYWVCCMVPSLACVIGFRPLYMLKPGQEKEAQPETATIGYNWNMTGLSWSHVQYRMS